MFQDILSFIAHNCKKFQSKTFIHNYNEEQVTYSEFFDRVLAVSKIVDDLKIESGTKVCIALPNCPEFLYLLFACHSRGTVAVNLNPQLTADEFDFRFQDAGVKIIFTTLDVYERIESAVKKNNVRVISVRLNDEKIPGEFSFVDFKNLQKTKDPTPLFSKNPTVFLQYTGGTTGKTKAAVITHENVLASVQQMSAYLSTRLKEGKEIFIVTFPFYHVFSIVFQVLMAMHFGSTIILYPMVKDFPLLAQLMQKHNFTVFAGVHTLYKMMLQHPDLSKMKFPSAKIFIAGAEHVQPVTKERWLKATGHLIVEGYGLTETSALASMSALNESKNDIDSIGQPLPQTEFKLIDEKGNLISENDVAGEICIKGPQVVSEYWNRPDENKESFTDGWLRTGDIAIKKSNGNFKIIDRKKDMINVSGFKVYPNEVEAVLMQFPGISDCAAVATPDEKSGERVASFIVAEKEVNVNELLEFCRKKLTAYKVPVQIFQISALPKSAVGKTLRSELRKKVLENF